jgi:3-(3-hydroxy-phenyl)propionate hydroxylase
LFVQPRLAGGGLMDDVMGRGWRWVTLDGCMPQNLPDAIMPCVMQGENAETQGVLAHWLHKHQCRAALVRPDHVVFGTASTPEQADALMLSWAEWMAPEAA